MGEIDTKPIESVQVGITLFGDKSEKTKHRPGGSSSSSVSSNADEMENEEIQKELAYYKVQIEAKDAAYSQLLHKLENYQKTHEQLLNQLKNCEIERDVYFEEYKEAQNRVDDLESKVKGMSVQLSETGMIREHLSHVLLELKSAQTELLCLETELVAAQDAKLKALTLVDIETDETRKNLEIVQNLENQLTGKKALIDSLQVELKQANELLSSSDKAVSDVTADLNKLNSDLKMKEKENSYQAVKIGVLEIEVNQLKLELKNANDEISGLNCEVETVTEELEKAKTEMEETKGREHEAQREIAMLKAERMKLETKERITITKEEYEGLTKEAEKGREREMMKEEMEAAKRRVTELRTRAEQARTRAEAAEKAKLLVEEQLRKWREQKQRRKAALAALREESLSREFGSTSYEPTRSNHQPLGKVLNMKF